MRANQRQYSEDANLQADVMRFMAIVAFCLIAILAMVRQTPSQTPEAEVTEEIPEVELPKSKISDPEVSNLAISDIEAPALEAPLVATPEVKASRIDLPEQNLPEIVAPQAESAQEPEIVKDEEPIEAQGLTLRFASERDFLRLVGTGKVTVYAYDDAHLLSLDRNHRFHEATPPDQVHELDSKTIPALLRAALPSNVAPSSLTWAVELPAKVEQQIQQHLGRVEGGELHINRYEEVRHVPLG